MSSSSTIETVKEQISLGKDLLNNIWIFKEPSSSLPENIEDVFFLPGANQTLKNTLISAIEQAREFICISSFLFDDTEIVNALITKAEEGIRIYFLSAPETHLDSDPDTEWREEQKRRMLLLLKKLKGKILMRSASHLHAKFLLIDPCTPNSVGLISTTNFTTKAMTKNDELLYKLSPKYHPQLFRLFLIGFWEEADQEVRDKLQDIRKYIVKTPPFSKKQGIIATTKKSKSLRDVLNDLIDNSKPGESIILTIYSIGAEHSTTKKIVEACERGVKVSILVWLKYSNAAACRLLAGVNAQIFAREMMHAKTITVKKNNGIIGIIMTANIMERGLDQGFETGIFLDEAMKLREIQEKWIMEASWEHIPEVKIDDLRNNSTVQIESSENREYITASVVPIFSDEIKNKKITCLSKLSKEKAINYTKPRIPIKKGNNQYVVPKLIEVSKKITLPNLPSGAKPVEKKDKRQRTKFTEYRVGKAKYYSIKVLKDLTQELVNLVQKEKARIVIEG